MILFILAGLSLAIWIVLVFFRGQFWRADQCLAAISTPLTNPPSVVAIIPARNEEMTIGRTITSLLAQNYPGDFSITMVDDNSDDDTANAAKIAAQGMDRVTMLDGSDPPQGWTGKMWAVAQGITAATAQFPSATYYLLTDADIAHHPENLTELMAKALDGKLALVSLMVRLRCETWWEHLLMPALV
ncbi:MAG: glycosyltransferase, partial [Rhodospirillaceae bacterium]|nr:glycosyltransferase [Rhodospirillaceae bacterium]